MLKWIPIRKLVEASDDDFVLAKTDDRRMMLWRVKLLRNALRKDTPNHLQFPATHFIPKFELDGVEELF